MASAWLSGPGEARLALVEDEHGSATAYADLAEPDHGAGRIWLFLSGVPERNGDDETLGAALGWAETTTRAMGLRLVRAPVLPDSASARFLAANGYRTVRYSFQMRIELGEPPAGPDWPAGVAVRPFEPGQERAVFDAIEAAFADHWDWTSSSFEEWRHHMTDPAGFDPTLWLVARDGDEIAGACICRYAPGDAALRLGRRARRASAVAPSRARSGTAARVVRRVSRRAGTRAAGLGVDGENTTGAVRALRAGRDARRSPARHLRAARRFMSRLRARCPDCRTLTAVAFGTEYQCHACGREFRAGLVRVPRAWGDGGEAMAEAAQLPLPYPEAR